MNLIDLDTLNVNQRMDAILCRNAFIYLTDQIKEKISQKFFGILSKAGILILGNTENIDLKKVPFKLEFHKGGPVYIKPD